MHSPQRLAQMFFRLFSGCVAPEEAGQKFARLSGLTMADQITEQFLGFAPFRSLPLLVSALNGEMSKQINFDGLSRVHTPQPMLIIPGL